MKREKIILSFGRRWDRRISEKYDFEDVPKRAEGRRSGLYILYNKKRIVYIGKSVVNLRDRIKQHTRDHLKNKWDFFTWFITRKRHTSVLEALLHNIFWDVRDMPGCSHKAHIKTKRCRQQLAIKVLREK